MNIPPNPAPRQGYFRHLLDSTRSGAEKGYEDRFEARTLSLYDRMKNQPRFQKDGMPVTVGEFCQSYPAYRHSAVALGVVGAVCGGALGLACGLVGRHF